LYSAADAVVNRAGSAKLANKTVRKHDNILFLIFMAILLLCFVNMDKTSLTLNHFCRDTQGASTKINYSQGRLLGSEIGSISSREYVAFIPEGTRQPDEL
jgi:hypothetical protein